MAGGVVEEADLLRAQRGAELLLDARMGPGKAS